ncbi:MAG: nucleoside kinase [Clostridiales Family XIII bacterium]|jgi:uridine kinase|nr:nucleoside kinase [Clostridiales Family XIII bacterium]
MEEVKIRLRTDLRAPFEKISVRKGLPLSELAAAYQPKLPYRILAAKVNRQLRELNKVIDEPEDVTLLDMRANAVNLMYQRSLSLLYLKAIRDVLGKVDVFLGNSLNKGIYTTIRRGTHLSAEELRAVDGRMRELVKADVSFVKEIVDRETALAHLREDGSTGKIRLLESAADFEWVAFYSLDGFRNYFYGQMLPSTGYIEHFELRAYRNGVLLRFPHRSKPDEIPPYTDEKKLYGAFGEANRWGELLGISMAADLNERAEGERAVEMIQLSEALHEKSVAGIADRVAKENKRLILIAGPSSSGKTTFARRLCIQLKVIGLSPLWLSTDDYFVNRADCPTDATGEKNFEEITALDLPLFNAHMNALLHGETADIPRYDFQEGAKFFGERITRGKQGQLIVIEGIHGLNEQLTADIDDGEKFKIYISPLTALNIDEHNRIPTTDVRFLRRMIRDARTRGIDAKRTIATWPAVRAGEDKNIFPFSGEADVLFNSAHIYELAVLKKYAMPLLGTITETDEEYSEAYRLRRFLQFFKTIKDDSAIVNNSILREFIGGSIFEV